MYDTSEIRKGLVIKLKNEPFIVTGFQFVNPGKGAAFYRTKVKNMITGSVLEKTFKSGEKLESADVEEKTMEYLYADGTHYVFMDSNNYEQIEILQELIEDKIDLLLENTESKVMFYNGEVVGLTLPTFIEVEITETGPADKGNSVTSSYKPAVVSTGATINVPMFIKNGDKIKVDTRTREYVERV
ncbi:MAG: elongation factor P [Spirochaetes bacterium]|nr:elongation factor P [Spirochaetota bacterium]